MQRFAPNTPVKLDPPKDQSFTKQELLQYDGIQRNQIYLSIKGTVFDVTHNTANYGPQGGYRIFAGKDCSRALAKTSLKPEDVDNNSIEQGLTDKELKVLDEWYQYFVQRYNILGALV
jgi:membrane-associated progesterone receptor component